MLVITKTNDSLTLLSDCLAKQIPTESFVWLQEQQQIIQEGSERKLFTAFSSVPRYIEKTSFKLSESELAQARSLQAGWAPDRWTLDQVGRTLIILAFPLRDADRYVSTLDKIFAAADVGEAVALYQSLPLLSHPERFKLRAAEGIRTNMTVVFNAVALHNPYPAEYLDNLAWNQMILKALFVGTPLYHIYGLQRRNNRQLAQMLLDYACERLAAKRTVNPELCELAAVFQPETVTELKAAFDRN